MARVAAIDCGTNSIRLLIADVPEDGQTTLTDIDRRMEIVRLGEGVDRTGRLAPAAIERTRLALGQYLELIGRHHVDRIRMVATSATRDAANAGDFEAMVIASLGAPPKILSGFEEAQLSFLGSVRGLPADLPTPYLVVDIGGGSTEFVRGGLAAGAGQPEKAVSVDIGCVRMTERHLLSNPPTLAQIVAAEADITAVVDRAVAEVDGDQSRTLIGLAGSVTTVVAMALGLDHYQPARIHHARVRLSEVDSVTAALLAMTAAQRLAVPVMHPGRADVIGGGALILRIIMQRIGADEIIASEHDILDGIAYAA